MEPSDPSGGADSGVMFGATVLIIVGVLHALQGFAATQSDSIFEFPSGYTYELNMTSWGWLHMGLGVLLILTGVFLFKGSRLAGISAVVIVGLSTVANFAFLPQYPFWGLLIILLEIWVIWAIFASGILSNR